VQGKSHVSGLVEQGNCFVRGLSKNQAVIFELPGYAR
jgi:hypothetical protein